MKHCTNIPYKMTFHFLALTLVQFSTLLLPLHRFATFFKICQIIMLIYAVFRAVPIPLTKNEACHPIASIMSFQMIPLA